MNFTKLYLYCIDVSSKVTTGIFLHFVHRLTDLKKSQANETESEEAMHFMKKLKIKLMRKDVEKSLWSVL